MWVANAPTWHHPSMENPVFLPFFRSDDVATVEFKKPDKVVFSGNTLTSPIPVSAVNPITVQANLNLCHGLEVSSAAKAIGGNYLERCKVMAIYTE